MRIPSAKLLAFALLLIVGASTTPQKGAAQSVSVSFQLFYNEMSPYGTWVDYQNYGYVWIPDVDRDFSPYGSDGHWIFTDDGWTWVSDYSWGWAPFHYGRWAYDDSYGWLWVPNNEWGPAWVTWRRSEGYYGWAPMRPGISVELSFGEGYRVPDNHWRFVSNRDISRTDIHRHYVDRSTNVTIINNSTVINNTYVDNTRHTTYVSGPKRDEVQKVTGTTIRPVAIQDNDKPGQTLNNDQLRIYRPHVKTNVVNEQKPVPTNVIKLAEVTPVAERKKGRQQQNDNPAPSPADKPSQPQNPAAIDKKAASEMPPAAPPHDEKKNMQEKPVPVNPEVRNNETKHQPQPPNAGDKGKSSTGTPPVVADPNGKNKNPEYQAPPPNVNKKGTKSAGDPAAGQQPPAVNPNNKNKGTTPPPAKTKGKTAKPPPAKIQGEDNKAPKSDKPKKDSTDNHSQNQLR